MQIVHALAPYLHYIQQNGYREDLKKALLEALRNNGEDVREKLREAAEKEVVFAVEANDLFERL